VTEEQLEEALEVSGLLDENNKEKLIDYIPTNVRERCEQLKVIDPSEEKVDVIETFLFLINNFDPKQD